MVLIDWIRSIWLFCRVTSWCYTLVVVNYFSRFVKARGYEFANQKAIYDFWLGFFILVFGFSLYIFYDNGSYFTGAEITAFFKDHGIMQIRMPINHLVLVRLVERNIWLVINQVRKWLLDRRLEAKIS